MTLAEKFGWHRVSLHLFGQLGLLLPTTVSRALPTPGKRYDCLDALALRIADLRIVSQEYDAEIDAAIDAHTMRLEEAGLEGQSRIWLSRRLEAAQFLAAAIETIADDQLCSVFPHPALEDKEVVHFLLTEWWYKKGLRVWAATHSQK
jgi:hypothetical protein